MRIILHLLTFIHTFRSHFRYLLLALTTLAAIGLTVPNSSSTFNFQHLLGLDHPNVIAYESFNKDYPESRDWILLANWKRNTPQHSHLSLTNPIERALATRLQSLLGLEKVRSLADAQYLSYRDQTFALTRFYDDDQMRPEGRRLLRQDPLWKMSFRGNDERSFIILLRVQEGIEKKQRNALLSAINTITAAHNRQHPSYEVFLLGHDSIAYHFDLQQIKQQSLVIPSALVIVFLGFLFFLRSWIHAVLSMSCLLVVCACLFSIISSLEGGLNTYTSSCFLFVIVITTADIMHFMFTLYRSKNGTISKRCFDVIVKIRVPCSLSSATTAIGFSSLSLSSLTAVADFGIYCTLGIILAWLFTFSFLPFVIIIFTSKVPIDQQQFIVPNVRQLDGLRSPVFLTTAGLVIASICLTLSLKVDENIFKTFTSNHALTRAFQALQTKFNYLGTIDLLLPVSEQDFLTAAIEKRYQNFQKAVTALDNVADARSVLTLLTHIRQQTKLDQPIAGPNSFAKNPLLAGIYGRMGSALAPYFPARSAANETRMIIRLRKISGSAIASTSKAVKELCHRHAIPCQVTGFAHLRMTLLSTLKHQLMQSFAMSFLGIFIAFYLTFRSWTVTFAAMIPNLLPVLFITGFAVIRDINIDVPLIMATVIILGVAVDDTIHFLIALRDHSKDSIHHAIERAYQDVSRPLIATTLLFVCTMPVLFLTDMQTMHSLAMFLIIALIIALASDFILLPQLFLQWPKLWLKLSERTRKDRQ